ncbi:MAG TPA: sugar ABC transporter permease [Methylomirabilota bacterium]|jgi:multiple sugar transport system permease protein|nr:sugar ABC transporter permease [Methylomirabilota bacterium]
MSGGVANVAVGPRAAARLLRPGWAAERRRAFLIGLAPALVVLAAITVAPALYLLVTSLTPLSLVRPDETAWNFSSPWANFVELAGDERFTNSLWVQLRLSVSTVTLQLLAGLAVAVLLNARSRFLGAVRATFLIPMVLPPIVVAILWKVLYTPEISPLHRVLAALGHPMRALITDPSWALWAIAVADVWEWFPFTMLMVLAALQMMPAEPLEAARIDGAGPWPLFRFVVLPLLRPTLVVAALFRLIDSIKAFPLIYVLTGGGPGTVTEVTNYYAFVQAFNFSYWGYASAITVVMVSGVFFLSWVISRLVGLEVDVE